MSDATNLSDELERIRELHDNGTLTFGEFEEAKKAILKKYENGPAPTMNASSSVNDFQVENELYLGMPTNSYCMMLHLSQFLGWVVPFAGFLAPLFLWIYAKDRSPEIDAHGKEVVNWVITLTLATIVSLILCLVLIGFVLLIVLFFAAIIYPILGALAANEGRLYQYSSIKFIR